MSKAFQDGLLALLIVSAGSGSARANWWAYPTYSSGYYNVAYYYPVVTPVYYYAQPVTYVCPVPVVRPAVGSGIYAQPQPAPPSPSPSQSKEPPLGKKTTEPPKVSESQSFSMGDAKVVPVAVDNSGNTICRVGFWNASGRDVKLTVSGKAYTVPRDRNLTLTLSREFSWNIEGRDSQAESVADDVNTHEIVIR